MGPGRGSAAGSVVAYALNITNIDPLKYGLLFERFLNPERVSIPDFDIDFCFERRKEVIDHVTQKYGADRVAHFVGGSDAEQLSVSLKVSNHLGLDLDPDQVEKIAKRTFDSKAKTFHKGMIGQWQSEFNEHQKKIIINNLGNILDEMNYV